MVTGFYNRLFNGSEARREILSDPESPSLLNGQTNRHFKGWPLRIFSMASRDSFFAMPFLRYSSNTSAEHRYNAS